MFDFSLKSDFVNHNYEKVFKDEQIAGTARHDLSHVLNVVMLVENVLGQLDVTKDYMEAAKSAALLHDLGCIYGKKGHALNSVKMVNEYLDKNHITINYRDEILDAIKNHGSKFDSNSLMTLALIMCDKIDLTKKRLAPEGFKTIGVRQLQYIEDIRILIANNECVVDFIAGKEIDLTELNSFEFLDKTFKAIFAFSSFNNLKPIVRINGNKWSQSEF